MNRIEAVSGKFSHSLALSIAIYMVSIFPVASNAQDTRTVTRDGNTGTIQALSEKKSNNTISPSISKIVLYRPLSDRQDNAVSVFVNDMYHASLVGGGATDICLPPELIKLSARLMKVSDGPKDQKEAHATFQLANGKVQYVKVMQQAQVPVLQAVSADVAERDMSGIKRQVHTISRVIGTQDCQAPKGVAQVELKGDNLFQFARADRSGLSSQGLAALDAANGQIQKTYGQIKQIRVIGHADPIGDAASNQLLSEQRARTVLQYLQDNGLTAGSAQAIGMGSSQPVVSCATASDMISCNAPNRRVVIELIGQPR